MEKSTLCVCTIGMDSACKVAVSTKRPFCMLRSACPAHHLVVPVGFLKIFSPIHQRVPVPAAKYLSKSRTVNVGMDSCETAISRTSCGAGCPPAPIANAPRGGGTGNRLGFIVQ